MQLGLQSFPAAVRTPAVAFGASAATGEAKLSPLALSHIKLFPIKTGFRAETANGLPVFTLFRQSAETFVLMGRTHPANEIMGQLGVLDNQGNFRSSGIGGVDFLPVVQAYIEGKTDWEGLLDNTLFPAYQFPEGKNLSDHPGMKLLIDRGTHTEPLTDMAQLQK